jgi:hypothetical protein
MPVSAKSAAALHRDRVAAAAGSPESPGYDPYVYPWYETRILALDVNDRQIAREIRDELFWCAFVDSDDIEVSVEHGVATLTGTVGSPGEYLAGHSVPAAGMPTRGNDNVKKHR